MFCIQCPMGSTTPYIGATSVDDVSRDSSSTDSNISSTCQCAVEVRVVPLQPNGLAVASLSDCGTVQWSSEVAVAIAEQLLSSGLAQSNGPLCICAAICAAIPMPALPDTWQLIAHQTVLPSDIAHALLSCRPDTYCFAVLVLRSCTAISYCPVLGCGCTAVPGSSRLLYKDYRLRTLRWCAGEVSV